MKDIGWIEETNPPNSGAPAPALRGNTSAVQKKIPQHTQTFSSFDYNSQAGNLHLEFVLTIIQEEHLQPQILLRMEIATISILILKLQHLGHGIKRATLTNKLATNRLP
jgi:hypothetical protein